MSHHVGVMYLGLLVKLGPRQAVFEDPRRIARFPLGRRPEPSAHDEVTPGHFVLPRN